MRDKTINEAIAVHLDAQALIDGLDESIKFHEFGPNRMDDALDRAAICALIGVRSAVKTAVVKAIIGNANKITIVNDGQFRYPVLTSAMKDWVANHGAITTSNYEQFCADVECIGEKAVSTPGSPNMIDLCSALIEAGAESERLE